MIHTSQDRNKLIIIFSIIILSLICFYQNVYHEFVNYDDISFVVANSHVSDGLSFKNIFWSFTTTHMAIWHPITWFSHIMDCQVFGLNPGGHHLMSILLHILNSILLFLILNSMTGALWRSGLVAILFAIHPLHVESVSWIAARKDLISTLFVLLSIRSYITYTKRPNWKNNLRVTLFFAMALMSKPLVIFLPLLFILLDFWPLNRYVNKTKTSCTESNIIALIKEKTIWFILAATILIINYHFLSKAGWIGSMTSLPLTDRLANVPYVIFFYLSKFLYPASLSVFYPYPEPPGVLIAIAGFLVIVLITLVLFRLRHNQPYLLFGWLWFLVGLMPVLGLIQQAHHLVADRYMYIPLIGLSILLIWGIYEMIGNIKGAKIIYSAISAIVIIILMILCFSQANVWENSLTLFDNALKIDENNYCAHSNIGGAYFDKHNYKKAINHSTRAIEITPYFPLKDNKSLKSFRAMAYTELGNRYLKDGNNSRALKQFESALVDDSLIVPAQYGLGIIYSRRKLYKKAINYYKRAIELGGDSPNIRNNLAAALMMAGKYDESEKLLKWSLSMNQKDYMAVHILACVYSSSNKPDSAVWQLQELVDAGHDNWQLIKNDPGLSKIKDSKVFLDFLKRNNQLN